MTLHRPSPPIGAPTLAPTTKTPVAAHGGALAPLLEAMGRHSYALHYGNARSPMVRVVTDDHWPDMWRMLSPDRQLSDMTNLSRIKDAAAEICDREPPRTNSHP